MSRVAGIFNILIYGEYFLPVVGGVQNSMKLLAKGLVEQNSQEEYDHDFGHIAVTVVTRTPANGMDDSALPYRVIRRPKLWQLIKLIRMADVIHVAGPCLLPMTIGWLMSKPIVVEHHGYQAICPNGLLFLQPSQRSCLGYFMRKQYGECLRCCSVTMGWTGSVRSLLLTFPRRWLCKRIAANITITDHVAARVNLPRSRTVYYGIEEPVSVNIEDALPPSKPLEIAYVGRLVAEKGLPLLLEAAKYLKVRGAPFKLEFIGDGPERKSLEKLSESLGLSGFVRFTGDLRDLDLDRAVRNVAAVVMPSVWEETAGLSAIEQMMRGRVVIAADIGGLSEVVDDTGLRFTPGDAQALASCIQQVIDNPTLITSLGSAARARAMRLFNQGSMVRDHLSLYRKVAFH